MKAKILRHVYILLIFAESVKLTYLLLIKKKRSANMLFYFKMSTVMLNDAIPVQCNHIYI